MANDHWLDDYDKRTEIEDLDEEFENWNLEIAENKEGPVSFTNKEDGSEVFLVRFTPLNTFSVSYQPSEDSNKAMMGKTHRNISEPQTVPGLENCIELAENYMRQHNKKN